ncbi:YceI family protein [Aliarcobacter butzleri]|uniref:YceI family protein n=1 Tax=Aliarcobacter butzleri TaxID=28197 RepID=UPI00263D5285|nr:YceI family protein [Aliarcobacter butzleri]MDN5086298.1 YceI family protein [Aliarcobacter butzleri]
MKKVVISTLGLALMTSSLYAGVCSDKLKYDFTFYGAEDKSYVVTKNTFKTATSNFPSEKLLNATLNIDAMSIDTHADMSNVKAQWPAAMATVRDNNIRNSFFKIFEKDAGKVDVKIVKVGESSMDVEFKMNGVTKVIPFAYKTEGDTIKATGKLDVLAFGVDKAWAQLSAVAKPFHHGKSWSEIDINFEVPASCK